MERFILMETYFAESLKLLLMYESIIERFISLGNKWSNLYENEFVYSFVLKMLILLKFVILIPNIYYH